MDTFLENTRLLLTLYLNPLRAMSGILDKGSLVFAIIAAIAFSLLLHFAVIGPFYQAKFAEYEKEYRQKLQNSMPDSGSVSPQTDDEEIDVLPGQTVPSMTPDGLLPSMIFSWVTRSLSPFSIITTLLTLALLYVPGTILIITLLESLGSFSVVLRRDYGSLLLCTLMAFAAMQLLTLPVAYVLMKFRPEQTTMYGVQAGGFLFLAVLMGCALRIVFGAGFGKAILTISVSWIATLLSGFLFILMSPFLLYYLWFFVRGDVGDMRWSFMSGRSYRRFLEASTINPHDAEAHYQLGLIHLQRRQITEATERFKRAIEIDNREIDAHFQLGRLARQQGRLSEAIEHFNLVVAQNESYALSDIWREVGATYLAAGMAEEARTALEKFIARREHDPEGLYHLGETYSRLNLPEQAQQAYSRCIEAANTMPYYRRGEVSQWRRLAQKQKR